MEYRKGLSAWRGQLLSEDERGEAVHAGADLRRRLIVLDDSLRRMPRQHARILCHEYFHFVWWRAGNPTRFSYEALLRRELSAHARGETGWSADWRKRELPAGNSRLRTRRWREYVCESFCDTGASLYGWRGSECTLARRHFDARRRWFDDYVASRGGRLPV